MGFSGSVNGTTKNPGFLDFGFCQCKWASRISFRKRAVYQRKWLEGHVAQPPKSQFRGHMAISLHDLRDASLKNTSGPSFELNDSN